MCDRLVPCISRFHSADIELTDLDQMESSLEY